MSFLDLEASNPLQPSQITAPDKSKSLSMSKLPTVACLTILERLNLEGQLTTQTHDFLNLLLGLFTPISMLAHGFTSHRAFRLCYHWHLKRIRKVTAELESSSHHVAINSCDLLACLDGLYLGSQSLSSNELTQVIFKVNKQVHLNKFLSHDDIASQLNSLPSTSRGYLWQVVNKSNEPGPCGFCVKRNGSWYILHDRLSLISSVNRIALSEVVGGPPSFIAQPLSSFP